MRAFITGCGSGFGHRLAQRLLADGWSVVASDPYPERLEPLVGAEKHRLDVRIPEEVAAVVAKAGEIDLLVNNAGHAAFGSIEESPLEGMEHMFAVNVVGLSRVTQALLPTLRRRSGTVVNLSSVAGRMVFAESGFYAASKHAVEAISEALYLETASFGMRVRVVEPGSFATRFLETAIEQSEPRSAESAYLDLHSTWDERKFSILEEPQDPSLVVDAIVASLDDPRPFLRLGVGLDAERLLAMRDTVSADAFVRLWGQRNGAPEDTGFAGDVYTPAELDGPLHPERTRATKAALHTGHLDHWDEADLARLRARLADS